MFCADTSHHHLLKCKPIPVLLDKYSFLFFPNLPLFPEALWTGAAPFVISLLGNSWEVLCFVQEGSLPLPSSFEREPCVFRNLVLEKFSPLCFPLLPTIQIIPPVLSQSGWSDRSELTFQITAVVLRCWPFLLFCKSQMKQGIGSEACTNCNHCEGVALPH